MTSRGEDDIEDAELAKDLAAKILQELPIVFSPDQPDQIKTFLSHDDLSMQNILVDDEGALTAIIDWECVSTMPLWRGCQLPQVLEGRLRDAKPDRNSYTADDDNPEDEGINILYWEQLLEYEQTELRKLFLCEMGDRSPEWIAVMRSSQLESSFEKAIHNCDNPWTFKVVKRWLIDYINGQEQSSLSEQLIA